MGDRWRGEEDLTHEEFVHSNPELVYEGDQAGDRGAPPPLRGAPPVDLSLVLSALREQGAMLTEILERLPPARADQRDGRDPCVGVACEAARSREQQAEPAPKDGSGSLGQDGATAEDSLQLGVGATSSLQTSSFHSSRSGKRMRSLIESRRSRIRRPSNPISTAIYGVVTSPAFDVVFVALILLNTVIMGVEEQHSGAQAGYELGFYKYYGSRKYDDVSLDGDVSLFRTAETVFAVVFTIEVILRIIGLGWKFFKRPSEYFDLAVVVLSDISIIFSSIETPINIQLLRLLRAVKLLRLVKLIRAIEGFDALHLMTTALGASAWALCWSILLLLIIQIFVAMIITNVFRSSYLEEPSSLSEEVRLELFAYFGTLSRSMMSLFELALANWAPICRWLMEHLHEGFMLLALSFKLVMGIAVIGVINAVFIQETFKVAHTDDDMMVRAKLRASKLHKRKMEDLFALADADCSGRIQRSELRRVLADKSIAMWLASMDLDPADSDTMFDLLKGQDELIDVDELITGIGRLRGAARSIDMRRVLLRMEQHREAECLIRPASRGPK